MIIIIRNYARSRIYSTINTRWVVVVVARLHFSKQTRFTRVREKYTYISVFRFRRTPRVGIVGFVCICVTLFYWERAAHVFTVKTTMIRNFKIRDREKQQ